jgi:hypothetical protein
VTNLQASLQVKMSISDPLCPSFQFKSVRSLLVRSRVTTNSLNK